MPCMPKQCQQPQTLLCPSRCSVWCNDLGPEGAKLFAEALKVNETLEAIE